MQQLPSVPWRALKVALGLGAAAAASLAFAGVASAKVYVITPDNNSGTDHLTAAINTANGDTTSTSNTIVMSPGEYDPATQPITITKNLTLVGDHTAQAVPGGPATRINGARANAAAATNFFVIGPGVSVTFEGFNLDNAGANGFSSTLVNGNLTEWGVETEGSPGSSLQISTPASATLNQSEVNFAQQDAINVNGHLTLNNVNLTNGLANGIIHQTGAVVNMTNSVLALQTLSECVGAPVDNGGPATLSDDATCGVSGNSITSLDSEFPNFSTANGGPTLSEMPTAGNPDTTGTGINCPTTDQRFFPNPVSGGVTHCDIGALTQAATQQTTAPSCQVSFLAADHSSQQVTLKDLLSGVGLQAGPGTDNPSNTVATAYPPPAAVPVPGDSVSNLQINNGSVAFTPLTAPSSASTGLVLTATKTTAGQGTQWSFTGMNWAGVAKNCF